MLFFLTKLVQPLFWPFNQVLILLLATLALLWFGKWKAGRTLLSVTFAWLLLTSMPFVGLALYGPLENTYPPRVFKDLPTADAIVVLGGTMSSLIAPRVEIEETHGSRVVPAYRLLRMNKAPVIVLSSGSWYVTESKERRVEAQDMRDFLLSLGAPSDALIVEGRSRNTFENARQSAKILKERGQRKILLVTSAFHMRRAVPLFEAEGLDVIPVPTEHRLNARSLRFWDFVPDLSSLGWTTGGIKERLGSLFYSFVTH
jgi:uncharacterized SAM-binding protein YcdF (DUF218 family)